jgi:type I restriction enzyme, S subunit
MKKGWEITQLGEICDILDSKRKPITQKDRTSGEYPYYGASGILDYINDYIFDESLVLIGEDGAKWEAGENSAFIAKGKYWVNNHAHVIRPKKSMVVDNWVVYYLNHSNLLPYVTGLTVPKLNQAKMREIALPLAPLPEQKRIVSILDEAFAAIAKAKENAEKNLSNAREVFESALNSVFVNRGEGWHMTKLEDVCEISSKLIDPKKPDYLNLIHIGGGNIESKTGNLVDLKTAKEEELISGKFVFDETMVLYSKIRPYLIKVVKCKFKGLCSADIYPLVPFETVLIRDFLYYLLITDRFTEYAIQGSQRAGMPKVNRDHLFEYRFYLPPLQQQQSIVANLDSLAAETKKLESLYKKKLTDLDELKKSILEKAFAGELNTN